MNIDTHDYSNGFGANNTTEMNIDVSSADRTIVDRDVLDGNVVGYVEAVRDGVLHGWALSRTSPLEPVAVQCLVEGQVLAQGLADRPRSDVKDAGFSSSQCGFAFDLREFFDALKRQLPITIEVRAGHQTLEHLGQWTFDDAAEVEKLRATPKQDLQSEPVNSASTAHHDLGANFPAPGRVEDFLLPEQVPSDSNKYNIDTSAALGESAPGNAVGQTAREEPRDLTRADLDLDISDGDVVGYVEAVRDGVLHGWALSRTSPLEPVAVQCLVEGQVLAQGLADRPRSDVKDAGFSSSQCGFAFDLREFFDALKRQLPITIEVRAGHQTLEHLGQWESGPSAKFGLFGRPSSEKRAKISAICLEILRKAQAHQREREAELSCPAIGLAANPRQSANRATASDILFQHTTVPQTRRTESPTSPWTISGYLDHVRYRYKVDQSFQLGLSTEEYENFLRWYIEVYSPLRAWRRAPLGAQELVFLSQLAPQRPATKVMSYFFSRWPGFNGHLPNTREARFELAYWWCVDCAPKLFIEDCLIPDWCAETLGHVRPEWSRKAYPLSAFMERYFSQEQNLHFLDLNIQSDRIALYLYFFVSAMLRPDLLRFLPREPLRTLLKACGGTSEEKGESTDLLSATLGVPEALFTLNDLRLETRAQMFDLESLRFTTISPSGHRVSSHALSAPTEWTDTDEIQVIGPFQKASGLGQAVRLSAEMIELGGFKTHAVDFGIDNPAPEGFSTLRQHGTLKRSKVNLLHLNAESIPLAFAYMPDVFSESYNIGYFYWELDSPANCHYLALDLLDEIWVSSEYCREIYAKHTSKPVVNVGMCAESLGDVSRLQARSYVREKLGLNERDFVFLSAFDSFSFVQRKNPVAVVRAFRAAFPTEKHVRLVLKTHNRHFVSDPQQERIWKAVEEEIEADNRVTLLNETLTYPDLRKLKAGVDCYVSLHRSEGWGFGMIESMASGIPVIATGYSGNMDFCNEENCFLVDYHETHLGANDYIFVVPGQKWAEPKLLSAIEQMRRVATDEIARVKISENALRFISVNFSADAISQRYGKRLRHVLSEPV